jgi:hypothetical protein
MPASLLANPADSVPWPILPFAGSKTVDPYLSAAKFGLELCRDCLT